MSNSYVLRRIKSGLFFLLLALLFGIFAVALRHIDIHTENSRFEKLTNRIFRSELASSSLDLHYFLAMPDKQGIKIRKISFGSPTQERPLSASYEKAVENFSPELLNEQNRRLQKVLRYYLEAQKELGDAKLCAEPLSPSLGVQAQLPVLLAEYSFRSKQDILDYLGLLKALPTYFKELLTLEQEKAQNGLFMNDACADGIIAQCNSFIENPDNNYLDTVFSEKINAFETLSPKERNALLQLHQKLLRQSVIPPIRLWQTDFLP